MSLMVFTNPATGATYTWEVNPSADQEQPLAKVRQIDRGARTANVGPVRQQGDDGPIVLDWTVNVFSRSMEVALWEWFELSRQQTIYVTDWDGEQYEGQIILLNRARKTAVQQYAVYQMQFEVYGLISGVLHDAGVTL